ncbi:SUMF1/EgtB/PvdO family nonheme iron enzyme [Brucella abortus]|nr:SUMF1/EgtB/PvdO family nonheme iron enzyme [Brucella abortus]
MPKIIHESKTSFGLASADRRTMGLCRRYAFCRRCRGREGDESESGAALAAIMSSKVPVSRIVTRPFGRLVLLAKMNTAFTDIGGAMWEWTQTCHRRVNIDSYGKVASETTVCGVYVVNGKHRAAMSSFIRNPKTGGCSVGVRRTIWASASSATGAGTRRF